MDVKDNANGMLSENFSAHKPSFTDVQIKAKQDASTTITMGNDQIAPWQQTSVNIEDAKAIKNSREPVKVDAKTSPAEMFIKKPDMPKPANLQDIKVNT